MGEWDINKWNFLNIFDWKKPTPTSPTLSAKNEDFFLIFHSKGPFSQFRRILKGGIKRTFLRYTYTKCYKNIDLLRINIFFIKNKTKITYFTITHLQKNRIVYLALKNYHILGTIPIVASHFPFKGSLSQFRRVIKEWLKNIFETHKYTQTLQKSIVLRR